MVFNFARFYGAGCFLRSLAFRFLTSVEALAAFRALSRRSFAVIDLARAYPPRRPISAITCLRSSSSMVGRYYT